MASICDVLDGRLSRLLKSESKLGAELDSLADFLNFGIAPSILIYISLLQNAIFFKIFGIRKILNLRNQLLKFLNPFLKNSCL